MEDFTFQVTEQERAELNSIAAACHMTAEELLATFVSDLTDSERCTDGEASRLADQWFQHLENQA